MVNDQTRTSPLPHGGALDKVITSVLLSGLAITMIVVAVDETYRQLILKHMTCRFSLRTFRDRGLSTVILLALGACQAC